MPLYEYQCDACGQRFEIIQKFSDPAPDACRKCGKGPVHRLASSPAIQFKGSGFYITDYAKGNSGATAPGTAKGDGDSKSSDSGSGSGSGDSKSEAGKGETKTQAKSDAATSSSPKPSTDKPSGGS
jgi:putative FmdB family regulatory protein